MGGFFNSLLALSFAGEDRPYVEMVLEQLKARSIKIFYDKHEEARLWGKDLYEHLIDVYRKKARFTLIFISKYYKEKLWTKHELRAAKSRTFEGSTEYILPARFDDTEIPGILPTVAVIDLRTCSPADLAVLVMKKLGRDPLAQKANRVPAPKNTGVAGEAGFDYSSHDGVFRIGEGHWEFETRWGKTSNTRIHCYHDGTNIRGVALAPKDAKPVDLTKVSNLDFTSRHRTVELGRFVVLQIIYGFFALLRVLGIKDDSRGDDTDELYFRFWIQTNGDDDFSEIFSTTGT